MKKSKKIEKAPKPELPIQRVITDYLAGIHGSGRDFMLKTGISKDMVGIWSRMDSYMGIDKLAKILETFPGARKVLIAYLTSINTEEVSGNNIRITNGNITPVQKRSDNTELAEAHRDLQRKFINQLERDVEAKESMILKLRNRLKEAGLSDE